MRNIVKRVIIVLVIVFCWIFSPGLIFARQNLKMVENYVEKNNVKLISRVQKECLAGSSITIKLKLENNSKEKISYGHVSRLKDFEIIVANNQGQQVLFTRFGQLYISGEKGQYKKYVRRELAPGESMSLTTNLARLYDLTVAGTYFVTIRRRVNEIQSKGSFVLEIPAQQIEVREPPE